MNAHQRRVERRRIARAWGLPVPRPEPAMIRCSVMGWWPATAFDPAWAGPNSSPAVSINLKPLEMPE